MSQPPINPSTLIRGQIYYIDWGGDSAGAGEIIEKERPSLIIQNNIGNQFSPYTIVAAIHHDAGKKLPIHVRIPQGVGGLKKDSVVDCGLIYTVPTEALRGRVGYLSDPYMKQVDEALKVSLEL
jgi:mRNA interferase MazF